MERSGTPSEGKSVSGKTLRIDLTGAKTAEIYLSSLAGVRINTLVADGNPGGDLPLAPYTAFDHAGRRSCAWNSPRNGQRSPRS